MAMTRRRNIGRAVAMVAVIAATAVAMASSAATTKHVVGGASQWTFGFNYTSWADSTAPFYTGDSLGIHFHSIILSRVEICIQTHILQCI